MRQVPREPGPEPAQSADAAQLRALAGGKPLVSGIGAITEARIDELAVLARYLAL